MYVSVICVHFRRTLLPGINVPYFFFVSREKPVKEFAPYLHCANLFIEKSHCNRNLQSKYPKVTCWYITEN